MDPALLAVLLREYRRPFKIYDGSKPSSQSKDATTDLLEALDSLELDIFLGDSHQLSDHNLNPILKMPVAESNFCIFSGWPDFKSCVKNGTVELVINPKVSDKKNVTVEVKVLYKDAIKAIGFDLPDGDMINYNHQYKSFQFEPSEGSTFFDEMDEFVKSLSQPIKDALSRSSNPTIKAMLLKEGRYDSLDDLPLQYRRNERLYMSCKQLAGKSFSRETYFNSIGTPFFILTYVGVVYRSDQTNAAARSGDDCLLIHFMAPQTTHSIPSKAKKEMKTEKAKKTKEPAKKKAKKEEKPKVEEEAQEEDHSDEESADSAEE